MTEATAPVEAPAEPTSSWELVLAYDGTTDIWADLEAAFAEAYGAPESVIAEARELVIIQADFAMRSANQLVQQNTVASTYMSVKLNGHVAVTEGDHSWVSVQVIAVDAPVPAKETAEATA